MDIYLPADFRELHAAAAEDWRDISTSCATHERVRSSDAQCRTFKPEAPNACVDPLWRVF